MSSLMNPPVFQRNPNLSGIGLSPTLAISEQCNRLRAEGRNVYRLGLGQSPFPVPPIVVAALREHAAEKEYLPVRGLEQLRAAVATYHGRRDHLDCQADDVLISPGSKELLFIAQLVLDAELLLPAPSWVSYGPQAQIHGRTVRWLETFPEDGWMLRPDTLEQTMVSVEPRCRMLLLNYPSNPTGRTFTDDALKEFARIAMKYGLIILSDEIYGEMHHGGSHRSLAGYYPDGTIVSSGLSKWCGAGGWRLGTFVFPRSLRSVLDDMSTVASESYTTTSAPIQYAAVTAFEGGPEIEDYKSRSRQILRALGNRVAGRLKDAGLAIPEPEGGFYLFPDFSSLSERFRARGIETSAELCARLLEDTGVATLPGSVFGCPADVLTLRLAYVDFDGESALEATNGYGEGVGSDFDLPETFLPSYCGNVLTAVDRMCDWLC